jgi:glycosyltransferase involved in cell wall biosynthesis
VLRILPLRRRADFVLGVIDALSGAAASYLAYRLRFEGQLPLPGHYAHRYEVATIILVIVWPLLTRASGLYRRGALRLGTSNLEPAFEAAVAIAVLLGLTDLVAFDQDLSRAWLALVVSFLFVAALVTRAGLRRGRRALVPFGLALERYAVVGSTQERRRLVGDLTRAPGAPFRIVAELGPHLTSDELVAEVERLRLDGVIAPPGVLPEAGAIAGRLAGLGADVLIAPSIADLDLRVGSIAVLHGVPLLRVAGLTPRRRAIRTQAKDRTRHGVAILGTRGIPANYGGFETFAERLALHLVGEQVGTTVYCRRAYATADSPWHGVALVTLPTIRSKYLDTVVHTFVSAVHLVVTRGPRDVVLCNAANAPVVPLLRLFGRRVLLNVDGLEWRRSKWGVAGRSWYRMGEWLSVRSASVLVTDADEVRTYYRVRHDTDSVMIPYGADLLERGSLPIPAETPVAADDFVLYVSRWERENNPVMVARAHATSETELSLVLLGQATYEPELDTEVRAAAGPRAVLPGPVYGDGYRGLQVNARCYVHATEVGGTHPALIEAMGAGNLCLVLDTPENREVAGPAAWFFADEPELAALIGKAAALDADELATLRAQARTVAEERYSWRAVGSSYLDLLRGPPSPA